MELGFWIITLDFIGKVLLAVVALMVHDKVSAARRITRKVAKEMRAEIALGVLSIVLFITSYVLGLYA